MTIAGSLPVLPLSAFPLLPLASFPLLPLASFPVLPLASFPLLSLAPPFFFATLLFHGVPFALVSMIMWYRDRLKNTLDLRCMVWLHRRASSDQHVLSEWLG